MDQIREDPSKQMYWAKGLTESDHASLLKYGHEDVSGSELLKHASGGLALRGVYLEYGDIPSDSQCDVVIQPTLEVDIKYPERIQSIDDIYLYSDEQAQMIDHSIQRFGFSVSSLLREKDLVEKICCTDQTKARCHEIFSAVPTGQCSLSINEVRLSPNAVKELKALELRIDDSKCYDDIQPHCKAFFDRFGSHVICGDIHLGGIYKWEAKLQADQQNNTENLLQDALDEYITKGTTSPNVSLTTVKTGGPDLSPTFDLWRLGLQSDQKTWAVIDREKTYRGIWEVVLNRADEFSYPEKLAFVLKNAWTKLTLNSKRVIHSRGILGLLKIDQYYPSQISAMQVMQLQVEKRAAGIECWPDIAWNVLQKLIMLDYRALPDELNRCELCDPNPIDVFLTIYSCCDLNLRQVLASRMAQCHLAIPFIYPRLVKDELTYSLWPLRGIVLEYTDEHEKAINASLTSVSPRAASFMRVGNPGISKSRLLNTILSKHGHDTFFHSDCQHGNTKRILSNGLVESSVYLPSSGSKDTIRSPTMFLNLRGDACTYTKQVSILSRISSVVILFVDVSDLNSIRMAETMKNVHQKTYVVIVLSNQSGMSHEKEWDKFEQTHRSDSTSIQLHKLLAFKGNVKRDMAGLTDALEKHIAEYEQKNKNSFNWSNVLEEMKTANITIDEHEDARCKMGKSLGDEVSHKLNAHEDKSKKCCLPLQGDLWHEWTSELKKKNRPLVGVENHLLAVGKIEQNMHLLRKSQAQKCTQLSELMNSFVSGLQSSLKDGCIEYFLQWLRQYFNDISQRIMPAKWSDYYEKVDQYKKCRMKFEDDHDETEVLKKRKEEVEKQLLDCVFGIEHLFREMGQMYEAVHYAEPSQYDRRIDEFPKMAAELLLKGQALELMDGDACGVPQIWIDAVLRSLRGLIKNKKMFTISVLGLQSSGKTTLLNTMFGLQLPVSAGRCTKGVYMQIVETKKHSGLPFDYLVVLDTEGLRAPEIGGSKYYRDNKVATFVIGLADTTVINIKGENVTEITDILQISIHAFLRMRMVNEKVQKNRSCIFVHQNVPALNAKEKMRYAQVKFTDNLDRMIEEAALLENISNIRTFSDVIHFDSETHVWYFSDLWQGDLPMAAVNPGYHEKVQKVKSFILENLIKDEVDVQRPRVFLGIDEFNCFINSMWNGVLADDFIFSFRNSLVVTTYNRLDDMFSKQHWDVERQTRNWLSTEVSVIIENCHTEEGIKAETKAQGERLLEVMSTYLKHAEEKFREFISADEQSAIMIEWEEDKVMALKSSAGQIADKAKLEIKRMAYAQKISLFDKTDIRQREKEIQEMARELAAKMKESEGTEKDVLEKSFQTMWSDWIEEITAQCPAEVDIWSEIQDRLHQKYATNRSVLSVELKEKKMSKLRKGIKSLWKGIRGDKGLPSMENKVDVYLQSLTKTAQRFQIEFAIEVIDIAVQSVQIYNDENRSRKISKDQEIKHVLSACSYALPEFENMQAAYTDKCSVRANLEKYRTTTWNLFENLVRQRKEEVIVADYIGDQFEDPIKTAVGKRLHQTVYDDIGDRFHSKCTLIRKMLKDLAEREHFPSYQTYVDTPKVYALEWLANITEGKIKQETYGQSWYVRQATQYANELCDQLIWTVESATCGLNDGGLEDWISAVSKEMRTTIAVPDGLDNLAQEYKIQSFENLKTLVVKKAATIKQRVIDHFSNCLSSGNEWVNNTPYEEVLDSLWGCEECCPFCFEPCKSQVRKHGSAEDLHECVQHRPGGVNGRSWEDSGKLVIQSCDYNVYSGERFSCLNTEHTCGDTEKNKQSSGKDGHPYRKYKKYVPHWHIRPSSDMESSHYWIWYLNTFKEQIAEVFQRELPDIPESWGNITKEKAIESLERYA